MKGNLIYIIESSTGLELAAPGISGSQGGGVLHGYVCAQSLQSCLILCDPMVCSLPGSSIHGILQARILEWVALPASRGSS